MSDEVRIGAYALDYAARGWSVFPLHGISVEEKCTCGKSDCASPGKHPRTRTGLKESTIDEIKIWHR